MKNMKLNRTLASLLIGGVVFGSLSSMAFAQGSGSTAPNNTNNNAPRNFNGGNRQGFNGQNRLKEVLDKLVKAKTITQLQENKILAYQQKKNNERQAEMQKLRNMTDAQRQAYFSKQGGQLRQGQNQNQFTDLVKSKTITQKQADAINKQLQVLGGNFRRGQNNTQNSKSTKPAATKKTTTKK